MKISYSNPFSSDKNFGKAINDFCELIPEDSWIVIQDGDMMYLTHDWGVIIERAIKEHGDKYDLLGCWTNRLNRKSKQIKDLNYYDDFDIIQHRDIAESSALNWDCTITPIDSIAGFFMCFKKSTWKKVGGFLENSKAFDVFFCDAVKKSGGKIGLIDQLYVFHLYRPWAKDPSTDSKHLDK